MYKEVLRSIEGVGIFPSIALMIFFIFFVWLVVYLLKKGRSHFEDVARLPLETDEEIQNNYRKES